LLFLVSAFAVETTGGTFFAGDASFPTEETSFAGDAPAHFFIEHRRCHPLSGYQRS
jgi:hypothetical protein